MYGFVVLSDFLESCGVKLLIEQKKKLYLYYELLAEFNKKTNLTSINGLNEVEEKHFLDSASLVSVIDLKNVRSLVDVGAGAGFPGLVLKILYPHLRVVLIDSSRKRVNFLNLAITCLKLSEIKAIHGRAEELGCDYNLRESFDLCVSRAVSKLNILSEYCIPFAAVNGLFVSYKSSAIQSELEEALFAVSALGGRVERVVSLKLGPSGLGRSLILIRKESKTPERFPRRPGVPKKKPLSGA